MAKCKRCNVMILDNTNICPLCQCVLDEYQYAENINQYPRVYLKQEKIKRISNIILLAVLASAMALILLNAVLYADKWWCIIPVVSMIYAHLIFGVAFVSSKGYRLKTFQAVALTLALVLIIDVMTGFHRWSLNYVLPASVLIIDVISIILMFVNFKEWQSYLIVQIAAIAFSMLPIGLWLVGIVTSPLLTFVAAGVVILVFLSTLIMGEHKARGELKRRFHIK